MLLPAWLIGSTVLWLWVPRFLLHRKIGFRALLPGALRHHCPRRRNRHRAVFVAAPWYANGKAFGSFGVVVTMVGYVFIMITMSLVCAVFSPVWANWRQTKKQRYGAAATPEKNLQAS